MIRDALMQRVVALLAFQVARQRAETMYLAGSASLFPDAARRWDAVVHDMQKVAVIADSLVELDGWAVIEDEETIPTEEQVEACLADLVEVARIKTLDDLGEASAAFDRTRRWLGAKRMDATSAYGHRPGSAGRSPTPRAPSSERPFYV